MNLSAILITCRPENQAGFLQHLAGHAWAQAHLTQAPGQVIVTMESSSQAEVRDQLQILAGCFGVIFAEPIEFWPDIQPGETDEVHQQS